ncbi:MAG: 50S ribosomal protein L34 [Candidatus Magnetobacterium sp. LHC-1]|uniref:Large ribosomal subunit protein bL34 n=1 Tax=Candidatus Magnetobacterium casense TaxID=1455061 RepID=A0ABS6RTS5_9BACT|nr:50S ribosomal protein L34 [Candidatus Magnetobacterium casensis]MBF0607116.1 50S ribosomal protein L34 [Nitrospirota bacterium]MBV6340022.1 50S ribosomal protein L34 [Candidatus Magnetobacterium casensis]
MGGAYTTYHPHKIKRRRKHGFLKRMSTRAGQKIIKRRRAKGRRVLAV